MDDRVYRALGLMSGTSLDGVDVAIIETDGVDIKRFRDSAFMRFSDYEKEQLQSAVQDALEWGFDGEQSLPKSFADAEEVIHQAHFRALRLVQEEYAHHGGRLRTYPALSVIGLHGQTVLHKAPSEDTLGRTLQLGDGERFARESRTDVVYDFRSADVAAGGQGAPLAPIYHEALVRYSKLEGRIAVLNIGGVSNVTAIEDGKIVWATDCGPGNGPLDSWMLAKTGKAYDENGQLSFKGFVHHRLINQWLNRDFFSRSVPRSADRYDFDVLSRMQDMTLEDGAATLASFCAQAIARDLATFGADKVIVCGGGRKNPAIMAMLDMHCDAEILSAEGVGWDGDMLEAQAFAYLAVRTLKGLPISFLETTGAPRPMTGGRIAYPSSSLGSRGGE